MQTIGMTVRVTVMVLLGATMGLPAEWPQWGGTDDRNMVSAEKGLPSDVSIGTVTIVGEGKAAKKKIDPTTAKNLKWAAEHGSSCYASPIVAGGRLYMGDGGRGGQSLFCLDAKTGKERWRLTSKFVYGTAGFRPENGRGIEWNHGMNWGYCSVPAFVDGRLYVVSPMVDVLCLDSEGLANGNDGPYTNEAAYCGAVQKKIRTEAVEAALDAKLVPGMPIYDVTYPSNPPALPATAGDIVWRYDMVNEQAMWFHNTACCAPLVHGDIVYVVTAPGNYCRQMKLSPEIPILLALDRKTGKLLGRDHVGMAPRVCHGTYSSPSLATIKGRKLVLVGGSDGICYAFDPQPKDGRMELVWQYNCNGPKGRISEAELAKPKLKKPEAYGEIIATPVAYQDRVYVALGRDPGHDGIGPGRLVCFDATGTGDLTDKATVWEYEDLNRSVSTVSIADGLLYVADNIGVIHCLDLATGKPQWKHMTNPFEGKPGGNADDDGCWGSTLVADGKVYVTTGKGDLWIFAVGKELKVICKAELDSASYATPIVANGVLYVATHKYVYAFEQKGR